MVEVGNGNLTLEESRTHFALWAAFKSPLIVGTRLEGISEPILEILKAKELIEFNQDPNYGPGVRPFDYGNSIPPSTNETLHPPSHYVGTSTKGIHLFLLNSHDSERRITVKLDEVPGLNAKKGIKYIVHNMWTDEDIGVAKGSLAVKVKKHGTAALRLTILDKQNPHLNP